MCNVGHYNFIVIIPSAKISGHEEKVSNNLMRLNKIQISI